MVKNFTKDMFPDASKVSPRHANGSSTIGREELGGAKCLKGKAQIQVQDNLEAKRDHSELEKMVVGVGSRTQATREARGAQEEQELSSALQAERAQRRGKLAESDDEPSWLVRAAEQLAQDSTTRARSGCKEPAHGQSARMGKGDVNWVMWSQLPLRCKMPWLIGWVEAQGERVEQAAESQERWWAAALRSSESQEARLRQQLERTGATVTTAERIIESQEARLRQQQERLQQCEDAIALLADALCEAYPHVAEEGARDRVAAGCRAAREVWQATAHAGAVAAQVPECASRREPQEAAALEEPGDAWVDAESESEAESEEEDSTTHFATLIGRLEASYAAMEMRRAAQQQEGEQEPRVRPSGGSEDEDGSGAETGETEDQGRAARERAHELAWRRAYDRREAAAHRRYLYKVAGERHRQRVEAAAAGRRLYQQFPRRRAKEDREVGERGWGHALAAWRREHDGMTFERSRSAALGAVD